MSPIFVLSIQPLIANHHGIKLGDAQFSDGLTARFGVLRFDPPRVHVVADAPLPVHEQAVEKWLAEHRPEVA